MKIFTPTTYHKKRTITISKSNGRNFSSNGNGGMWEDYKLNRDVRYWKWHYKFEEEMFKEVMF